jgi:hypothetical protein
LAEPTPSCLCNFDQPLTILYRRRVAKFLQHAIAQSLGIAFTGFRKIHDLVCEHVVGEVTTIDQSERYQRHLERKAHDPDRLGVEPLAI